MPFSLSRRSSSLPTSNTLLHSAWRIKALKPPASVCLTSFMALGLVRYTPSSNV